MTSRDVDPDTFYLAGRSLFESAGSMYDAFATAVKSLDATASMAGSDDAGTAWARTYDDRAVEVISAANLLILAMENYGGVLFQAGHNHAVAEYNANSTANGNPPKRPTEPASSAGALSATPSAGGPGEGLVDYALGLVEQIGVPVPDGDTEKIATAAKAWDGLAHGDESTSVVSALRNNVDAFSDTKTPEVDIIARDLAELRDAAQSILDGCSELARSCDDYHAALAELRDQLKAILENLTTELAATAVIGIAASFVSFGASAVAATAKAAHTITRFAKIIRTAIGTWKISKNISNGVRRTADIAGLRPRLQRIRKLGRKGKSEEPKPPPPRRNISDLFASGRKPKASELDRWARSQGWTKKQTTNGPPKYVDENGVVRMTIKEGSPRTPGSEHPHVELRDSTGQRIDPFGNPVSRKSPDNHTPIEWDW